MNSPSKDVPPTVRRELRLFGSVLGLLLALVGGYLLWQGRFAGVALLAAGMLTAAAFWRQCPGTRTVFSGWMYLAGFMGRVTTCLLLTVLYLCVLTPIALLARLCGQRFLDRGFRGEEGSYWRARQETDGGKGGEKQY